MSTGFPETEPRLVDQLSDEQKRKIAACARTGVAPDDELLGRALVEYWGNEKPLPPLAIVLMILGTPLAVAALILAKATFLLVGWAILLPLIVFVGWMSPRNHPRNLARSVASTRARFGIQ